MQIKTRLTYLFTSLIASLLLIFAITVYFTAAKTRKDEYYKRLNQQGATKASLLFDSKVSPDILQLIYKNAPNALFKEEVAIYDTNFHLLYHDAVEIDKVKETKSMIDSILKLKEINFYVNDLQVTGFVYQHDGNNYIITSAAKDGAGFSKLDDLRNTLIFSFLVSVIVIFLAGRFFAKKALEPVKDMIDEVKKITATNLDLRVDEGNRKDEIAALAITFNEVLDRLEKSFDSQKHFVSNISHELRTPLTAMLTEMQLTIQKDRTGEEYKQSISHIISDTKKLIKLSNSLLDLAKTNYDQTEISFKKLRLDEILLDARNDVMHNQPNYKVDIVFDKEIENEECITVNGNEYLLKMAFINLIENGCKFSKDLHSNISINYDTENIILTFSDNGIGINDNDIPKIFTPFYRGQNRKFTDGNGVGLFLTQKVINLHTGEISVNSKENVGTSFSIKIPHEVIHRF